MVDAKQVSDKTVRSELICFGVWREKDTAKTTVRYQDSLSKNVEYNEIQLKNNQISHFESIIVPSSKLFNIIPGLVARPLGFLVLLCVR